MWWRLRRSAYDRSKGAGNKRLLHRLVLAGRPIGVVAYRRGEPVGWCAIAPREDYPVLQRSRILKPVDGRPVWSVTCFFVRRDVRRSGITVPLLEAAAAYARRRGARIVEGYPHEPRSTRMPELFAATGFASTFRAAGFVEVLRRSPRRPVMRRAVVGGRTIVAATGRRAAGP